MLLAVVVAPSLLAAGPWPVAAASADSKTVKPAIIHIENIVLAPVQLHASSPDVIWYNNFDNFKWLGNNPKGEFPIHNTAQAGRWVCVEARLKLNTPGQKDGYAALWVDGKLDTERKNMDFRGSYAEHTINAVLLEAYWNEGSPVDQCRWYDDFVVSTKAIGPLTATANPTLIKMPSSDCAAWQAEIAADLEGRQVVWQSGSIPAGDGRLAVTSNTGTFTGSASGKTALPGGPTYFCRCRQQNPAGVWSDWSGWHQPFVVEHR